MFGLLVLGSYLPWIGLLIAFFATLIRLKETRLDEAFNQSDKRKHVLLIFSLTILGGIATVNVGKICPDTFNGSGFATCLNAILLVNCVAPIPAWIVNCRLWRRITQHKIAA